MDLSKGVPTLLAYCEKLIWKFFFKFNQGTCPWMAFALIFFGIYLIFFTGNISRGSNISCSLAFSYGNSHDMISFIIEIPEVEVQLLEWRVTLHLYV